MDDVDSPPSDGPVWAIVLAAGSGRRYGAQPKQYELLGGERVIDRALSTCRAAADHVIVVLAPGEDAVGEQLVADGGADAFVIGGAERSDSVRSALAVIDEEAAVILVHDAARPLASAALHEAVVAAVHAGADAAIPAVAVIDTIKKVRIDTDGTPVVAATLDRGELMAVQTPQAFRAEVLHRAHVGATDATDDAALVEADGGRVVLVPGETTNIKITGPEDLAVASVLLSALG
ncbi:MAG: 2-C-methyl-D-erythritol 4-phosphate cytidylyltransferase [Actinobacteria bacterium]|nr:2-C-methyl-D-erythritol 4-phosphate cytidylyltransferase [Actinomycetota bacterium]